MDTILVVNAGSSSVKFQVFAVDGDGRLQRQLKGQMDGIGSRPRLRATGAIGNTLADRAYPIEAVEDVSAALMVAGSWLRDELRITPMAVGHRVVHGGPDYDRPVPVDHGLVARLERYIAYISPTILRQSNPCLRTFLPCRRSRASTPPSIAAMTASRISTRSPISFMKRECGATDFTVYHTNISPRHCRRSRPTSRPAA